MVAHGSSGSRTRQKHRPCRTGWRRQDLAGRGHALRFRQDAAHGHDARRQVVPRLRPRGDQAQVHHFHLHRPHPLQGLQDQRAGHLRPPRLHRRHAGHHAGGRNGPVRGGRRRRPPGHDDEAVARGRGHAPVARGVHQPHRSRERQLRRRHGAAARPLRRPLGRGDHPHRPGRGVPGRHRHHPHGGPLFRGRRRARGSGGHAAGEVPGGGAHRPRQAVRSGGRGRRRAYDEVPRRRRAAHPRGAGRAAGQGHRSGAHHSGVRGIHHHHAGRSGPHGGHLHLFPAPEEPRSLPHGRRRDGAHRRDEAPLRLRLQDGV